jgi:RimJ/RimL family protein N-acetyltransferase
VIAAVPLQTPKLLLKPLQAEHANGAYLVWMNDPMVMRYTESRDRAFTGADLLSFIEQCNQDPSLLLLGMFDKRDGDKHIGNIKLGPIQPKHQRGDIGLIVGDRQKWGQGFAREAISAVTKHAFGALGLSKVTAGCYTSNQGSVGAFLAAGWFEEGRRKRHGLVDGNWEDEILLACLRDDRA